MGQPGKGFALAYWLTALVAAGSPLPGSAQGPCPDGAQPWVALAFSGAPFEDQLRAGVLADLSAGLATQGVALCPSTPARTTAPLARPPIATIDLGLEDGPTVAITVIKTAGPEGLEGASANQRTRLVELADVPADSRGLVLALTADELLRALGVVPIAPDAGVPEASGAPETTGEATVAAPVAQSEPAPTPIDARPLLRLAANAALEVHTAGLTQAGADVSLGFYPGTHVGVEAAFTARQGFDRQGDNGTLDLSAFGGHAALLLSPFGRSADTALVIRLGISLAAALLRGHPDPNAEGARARALDAHALLTCGLRQRIAGPVELALDAGLGAPLQAITLTDSGRDVAGTGGVQLRAGLGLGVRL